MFFIKFVSLHRVSIIFVQIKICQPCIYIESSFWDKFTLRTYALYARYARLLPPLLIGCGVKWIFSEFYYYGVKWILDGSKSTLRHSSKISKNDLRFLLWLLSRSFEILLLWRKVDFGWVKINFTP